MFTGIIQHQGKVVTKTESTLKISAPKALLESLSIGMSVAVDGICLTVIEYDNESFTIDFMPETANKTTIAQMLDGWTVNLEMPATTTTFLAGHVVQGHVDCTGELINVREEGNAWILEFSIPDDFKKFLVYKGSITLNGISLTIMETTEKGLTVSIIPHTWEVTNLSLVKIGWQVNVETDVLSKYIYNHLKNFKI
jgi:riboflavin synthase